MDTHGRFVAVNDAAAALTGYTAFELTRLSAWQLAPNSIASHVTVSGAKRMFFFLFVRAPPGGESGGCASARDAHVRRTICANSINAAVFTHNKSGPRVLITRERAAWMLHPQAGLKVAAHRPSLVDVTRTRQVRP